MVIGSVTWCTALDYNQLTVENMPLTVIIDSLGNDLYELGPREYLENRKD